MSLAPRKKVQTQALRRGGTGDRMGDGRGMPSCQPILWHARAWGLGDLTQILILPFLSSAHWSKFLTPSEPLWASAPPLRNKDGIVSRRKASREFLS